MNFPKLGGCLTHLAKLRIGSKPVFGFDLLVGSFFDFTAESFSVLFRRNDEEFGVQLYDLKHAR